MECFWCGRISVLAAPGSWMDAKSKRGGNAVGVAHAMNGGCIRLREAVLYIPILADIFGVVPHTTLVNQISTAMFEDKSIRSQED